MKIRNSKRFGFTLTEVFIVVGIVGVIAAMTIPTLLSKTGSTKYRAQFIKTLSTLNQVGRLSKASYNFDFADVKKCTSTTDNPNSDITICAMFNGTLTGHNISSNAPNGYSPTGSIHSSAHGQIPSGMPIL